jgi:2-aminobenzoate-CoA ligase
MSTSQTAHVDTFAADHMPALEDQPDFIFNLPELQFPAQLNCASELLDQRIANGDGHRQCLIASDGGVWTYQHLQHKANQIAHVLVQDMQLKTGNRVLLRAANTPMLVACWFAVMKVGAIAVATMPMLRAKELGQIIDKAKITHALCDDALSHELLQAVQERTVLKHLRFFNVVQANHARPSLDVAMQDKPIAFDTVLTAALDTCLLAFTSGTTGQPKATMHNHRDVMAACACWPRHTLRPCADDVFIGSPPLAFTFGLGGLVLFPMSVGASTVLIEKAAPALLLAAAIQHRATVMFTAPTSYRVMATMLADAIQPQHLSVKQGGALRQCVSAGEVLPAATRDLWRGATGIELIDGIGATELLHIFISADEAHAKGGATGTPTPGYEAKVVDEAGNTVPTGVVGLLAVRGPTGCRYLDDDRQKTYVKNGWNYTGDAYSVDEQGYFVYHARTDDMIISAGYNIAAIEVEEALLQHSAVAECAVIGASDAQRGTVVKAFVVLRAGHEAGAAMTAMIQDHVKQAIAPYKYPRAIEYMSALPRTETGKLQRFKLKNS